MSLDLPTCVRTTDPTILAAYAQRYTEISGHTTTAQDLDRSGQAVRVLYQGGRMIGGFVSRWEAPYRYLAIPPQGATLLTELDLDDLVESTHNWLERDISTAARAMYYAAMGWEGLRSGKRYALGGTSEPRIRDLHMRYFPELIYNGPGQDVDGKIYPDTWLYRGRISQMFLKLPEMMLRRSSRIRSTPPG
ncbi:MAG: hypothetical protein AAFV53_00820 [Myxococcota bacterium]